MSCRFCHCEKEKVSENSVEDMDDRAKLGSSSQLFEYFPVLPVELQMMVVDEMEPADRGRFSGCSRLSWKEAKDSKNYIYALTLKIIDEPRYKSARVEVVHNEYDHEDDANDGFGLHLSNVHNFAVLEYGTLTNKTLWKMDLDNSTDVIKFGTDHFKNVLKLYQNKIKCLVLDSNISAELKDNFDFEIESLKKLEKLLITCNGVEASQLLSKIQHPLKKLEVYQTCDNRLTADCEQVYQVQDHLELSCSACFNYEQFLRLQAKFVKITIDELTEQDICNFITSWKYGTYKGRIEKCRWRIEDSSFNKKKLCRLLQIDELRKSLREGIEIEQRESLKIAKLVANKYYLTFTTIHEDDDLDLDSDDDSDSEDSEEEVLDSDDDSDSEDSEGEDLDEDDDSDFD